MAVAFRSVNSLAYGAGRTSTAIPAPAGIVNGDTLIAIMFGGFANVRPGNPTPPAGFTQVSTYLTPAPSGFMARVSIWKKTAASESGSYTFTHTSQSTEGVMLCYSGSTGTVNASSALNEDSPGTTTRTATGITTTVANCMVVELGYDWGDSATGETPPTGMTERYDGVITYAADVIQATAGATGNKTNTCNSTTINPRGAFLIALEEAGGGGGGGGTMKVWSGSAWAAKPVKIWSGSAWVSKPVKVWSGSAWVVKG